MNVAQAEGGCFLCTYNTGLCVITLFSLIELSIAAWLTSKYNSLHNYTHISVRDRVRFTLFCSTWTICIGTMSVFLFLCGLKGSVAVHLLLLGLTWVFWLAAASVLTQTLGGGLNCQIGDVKYSQDGFPYCDQLYALKGFAWSIWILVTVTTIAVVIRSIKVVRTGRGYAGSLDSAE